MATLGTLLGGSILTAIWAGLLAASKRSVDVYVLDRYLLILPSRLFFLSAALVAAAFAVWKVWLSR